MKIWWPDRAWWRDGIHSLLHVVRRFSIDLVRNYIDTDCQGSAAALTYMTLFALVPFFTVTLSVFSIVPAFAGVDQRLQDLIFHNFVPETGEEIQQYITSFTQQARSLTGVGIGALLVTAFLMLTNIEKTFNTIWGVERARGGLSHFLLYWAVLSIGPILLGTALVMSGYLLSLKLLVEDFDALGLGSAFFRVLPAIMGAIAFTFLFAAVPNCNVPLRFAAIGGILTAVAFELLKNLFGAWVANANFQRIYGPFATLPLFILWINLVWTVILAGAIVVRTLGERGYAVREGKPADMVATLKVLSVFRAAHLRGGRVRDRDCYRLGLGVVHWQRLRGRLRKYKWIIETSSGEYVLARDLHSVTLLDLAHINDMTLADLTGKVANPADTDWFRLYLDKRLQLSDAAEDVFSMNINDLLTFKAKPEAGMPLPVDPRAERDAERYLAEAQQHDAE